MELKRHLDPRKIFVGLYVLAFTVYIIIGLQPAGATSYTVSSELNIPSIGLNTDVTELKLNHHQLDTPDNIVGSFTQFEHKTLLIGHSTSVFQNLHQVTLGSSITYDRQTYRITAIDIIPKSTISMSQLLAPTTKDTIVIMTCAGQLLGDGDATHRLIVTASV